MSAVQALSGSSTSSSIVEECYNELNRLNESNLVELYWIPAHSGYDGNERADILAKKATEIEFCGPEPVLPVSLTCIQSAVNKWEQQKLNQLWLNTNMCRQSKIFLNKVSDFCSSRCITLSRKSLRLLTHIVTGHNLLNSHQTNIGRMSSSLCKCKEDKETSLHYVAVCPRYCESRFKIFGKPILDPEDMIISSKIT